MGNQDETVFVNYEKSKGPDIPAGNKAERTGLTMKEDLKIRFPSCCRCLTGSPG